MLTKVDKSDAIVNFLRQDFLTNENIIGVIENMPKAEVFTDNAESPTGVLVKKDDYMHYVYTKNDAFLNNICESYFKEGFFGFSGVEGELAEKIRQRYLLGWESPCTLYYMPKENLDIRLKKNRTEKIRLEDAETVDKYYQYRNEHSLETIKRDITSRPSSAIYIDNEIVCWVLIHDDNSMGIMYTKEEHRRKGYAIDVTIDLAQQIIENGKIPFIQIVKGNGMSPGLAQKCGFVEMGKADWFGIIAGNPKELTEANNKSREQFLNTLPESMHECVYSEDKSYLGLCNFLYNFKYKPDDDISISLVKVEDDKQKQQWASITSKCLDINNKVSSLEEMLIQVVDNPNYNLYLLFQGDVAVAASSTLKQIEEDEDRGIYLISVLPEYDQEKIQKALIRETVLAEKNSNCHFMIAQAEEKHKHIYEELGFRVSNVI